MKEYNFPDHSSDIRQPLRSVNRPTFGPMMGRRHFFGAAAAGVTGFFLTPYAEDVQAMTLNRAVTGAQLKDTARNVIFVLMNGAPSHSDTFDLKVGAWTPADFNPTTYFGDVLFPQGLMPTIAEKLNRIGIVRSLRAPALVHGLQQIWVQIARNPTSQLGKIAPNVGSVVALEFEKQRQANQKLPGFVSLNTGGNLVSSGYMNPRFSPFDVTASAAGLGNLTHPDGVTSFNTRYSMLQDLDGENRAAGFRGNTVDAMEDFYQQSRTMMYNPEIDAVFKFTADDQTRFGNSGFGNSCIVARNLVKANLGTRYIQINIGGWDNHTNIYGTNRNGAIYGPATQFDRGLGNLLKDLESTPGTRGGSLLDETLVVMMGEFGRTVGAPNPSVGRDHFFQQFCAFAGGGIIGGRTIGITDRESRNTIEPGWSQRRNVANEDLAATIYSALGIDYTTKRYDDPFKRGFEYVPFASEGAWYPILELFERGSIIRKGGGRGTGDRPIELPQQ
ncbi:MAG: DUF1501 domain-containing protein [Acidobacteria bacterium]|nr:DUF1501 domain-containing protein [Acidobacteriota bacterium]